MQLHQMKCRSVSLWPLVPCTGVRQARGMSARACSTAWRGSGHGSRPSEVARSLTGAIWSCASRTGLDGWTDAAYGCSVDGSTARDQPDDVVLCET